MSKPQDLPEAGVRFAPDKDKERRKLRALERKSEMTTSGHDRESLDFTVGQNTLLKSRHCRDLDSASERAHVVQRVLRDVARGTRRAGQPARPGGGRPKAHL